MSERAIPGIVGCVVSCMSSLEHREAAQGPLNVLEDNGFFVATRARETLLS